MEKKNGGKRPGAGRKAADGIKPTRTVNVPMDDATYNKLTRIAGTKGRSAKLRELVRDAPEPQA